jgi:hypothetical protein
VYTLLEHGGDFTRAASALRGLGYGSAPASPSAAPAGHSATVAPSVVAPPPTATARRVCRAKNVYGLIDTFPGLRRPVIHGLLREGETMNVISAPKMGKSWLVTDLALSVATGRDWLGFRCERGDVLILDNELHGETNRIPRVAAAILQIAMFEAGYMHEIPVAAAIDAAVDLTKRYESTEVAAFVNGVLGAFARGEKLRE